MNNNCFKNLSFCHKQR